MSDTPDRPSDLSRIFDEFLVRRQLGESPILDEYCRRFPDLAEQLRLHVRLYEVLGEANSALSTPQSATGNTSSEEQPPRTGLHRIEQLLDALMDLGATP